jgi:EARP and GARP complex-interacting protein 1
VTDDILLLLTFSCSGGSDNLVNLWRIASSSSAPWLGMVSTGYDGDGNDTSQTDTSDPPDVKVSDRTLFSPSLSHRQVKAMDQHEECVYSVAWSPAEAWMYCSLSYEGRVILNHVPSTEKYKILL